MLRARIGASLEKKRLRDQEIEYLHNVDHVIAAAAAVEAGEFDLETLARVATRRDELGQLARVFQRMAREVYAREQRLNRKCNSSASRSTKPEPLARWLRLPRPDYFQDLQRKADQLRIRPDP